MTWRHASNMASSACIPLPGHHSYLIYFRTRRTSESRPQGYKPSLPGRPATAKARHSSSHVSLADHMIPSSLVPCSGLAVMDVIVVRDSQSSGLWRLMIDNSYQVLRCGMRLVEGLVIVVRFLMPTRRSLYQPIAFLLFYKYFLFLVVVHSQITLPFSQLDRSALQGKNQSTFIALQTEHH